MMRACEHNEMTRWHADDKEKYLRSHSQYVIWICGILSLLKYAQMIHAKVPMHIHMRSTTMAIHILVPSYPPRVELINCNTMYANIARNEVAN